MAIYVFPFLFDLGLYLVFYVLLFFVKYYIHIHLIKFFYSYQYYNISFKQYISIKKNIFLDGYR